VPALVALALLLWIAWSLRVRLPPVRRRREARVRARRRAAVEAAEARRPAGYGTKAELVWLIGADLNRCLDLVRRDGLYESASASSR
jgi:hypothetical protein